MNSPFTIVILGISQSGKSTLVFHLTKELSKDKKASQYTIIDGGFEFSQSIIPTLENAALILVITEVPEEKIKETQLLLNKLYHLVPRDLVYVVLNRYSPKVQIDPITLKTKLGCNILGALVEETSNTSAQPMISRYVTQLAQLIITKRLLEKGDLLQKSRKKVVPLMQTKTDEPPKRPSTFHRFSKEELPKDPRTLLKVTIMKQLTSELNLKKLDTETGNDPKKMTVLRQKTRQAVETIIEREKISLGQSAEKEQFIKEILDEALGLGPLEELLADPSITEIMVNRKDQIFIEKKGKVILAPMTFTSDAQLLGIIERIVLPLGRRIDEKTPYVDARLPDGSRVHAIIPPLALEGPVLTIRKFPERNYTVEDLITFGSMTEEMADFLRAAIESRLNCIVSGGTGSGKTTLLNVLSSFIPLSERIITVEDSAELRLTQPHVLRLESRPPNIEGTGAVAIRDLVKNTLRMRPDRIVVGECRDGAALDMLQAMNTGHDGSLTTIHSNSARDCIARLETLVMMAGMDLPSRAIREQIASAVHLIVQQARLSDGSRKIISIHEITGMEGNVITSSEIMHFKQTGVDAQGKVQGQFEWTGQTPKFIHDLEKKGLRLPKIFSALRKTGEGR